MSSQSVMQAYMDRHRIQALFEELMNKVLRDMPEEPLVYLLRAVYKKAGMEIPQGIRYGGLRKSTSELYKNTSPERRSRSAVVSSSADMAATRSKTLSPNRAAKLKDGTKISKQKPYWNADTKTKSSFDELWEDSAAFKKEKFSVVRKSNTRHPTTSASAWASVGLGEGEEEYTSPAYSGKIHNLEVSKLSEEELLASESVARSNRSEPKPELSSSPAVSSKHFSKTRKMESVKHKQELGQLLSASQHKLTDSGIGLDQLKDDDAENDDAIELLENADDLKREGVKHVPQTGFKLSQIVRHRENVPPVKLSINAISYLSEIADRYDISEMEQLSSDLDEEEEFESVSQVTGPRQPVWDVPDADIVTGDAIPLRPSYSPIKPQRLDVRHKNFTEKSLQAKSPVNFVGQSVGSAEDLVAGARTWTLGEKVTSFDNAADAPQSSRTIQSNSSFYGWRLPDDTDAASAYDWNQRVKGRPPQDPRAY
ncbi:hypothetical protein BsWGS_24061 [Bradybaena similaris]